MNDGKNIQVGWCTGDLEGAKRAGFDYVECTIRNVASLTEDEFDTLARQRGALDMAIPVGNVLLPRQLPIVGPQIDPPAEMAYLRGAFERCQRLGVEVVVFGSARSRRVPDGFPGEAAFAQLVDFAGRLSRLAAEHGMVVALEPVGEPECNIIVDSAEAKRLVDAVALPSFQLMIDLFHWHHAGEAPGSLAAVAPHIRHIHIANPRDRNFPLGDDGYDYRPFLQLLAEAGYRGRISIEGATPAAFDRDASRSVAFLKSLTDAAFKT